MQQLSPPQANYANTVPEPSNRLAQPIQPGYKEDVWFNSVTN